ncbi:probable (S)-N-methylcoclaurine 3'-hydroxylase isozyme 2 [Solanum tuberosum]|uniref:probable (S)-N-methylcoclaurine 3'-hydroxylase isozyme 2 n=1 Tax=Solanum tuberosum TaxID=4113 RepID=UPI00073A39F1|nr:PREDICTED: probable (S)-N-methylcoclaurine 3'-hydroxylase isozyme 2 [Solanum tuberosum]
MYGPLISIKLGTQLVVVASSPASATEILKTQDRLLSVRSVPKVATYVLSVIDQHSIVFSSDLSNHWKFLREFCRTHLFSPKAVESQTALREKKVSKMIHFLRSRNGETVKISEILFDLQGLRKQIQVYQNQLINIWSEIVKEKRQAISHGSSDIFDAMIDSGFLDLQINILLTELIGVGYDTTTATTEWAMTKLLRNKGTMHKLQAELTSKFGENDIITESNISELPYLGVTQTVWEDALSLKPEQFLDSNEDFRGQDFGIIPFGAGRTICPGLGFARQEIHLILTSLIHYFEWSVPNGKDPMQLDMEDKFGVTLHKEKPLLIVPM